MGEKRNVHRLLVRKQEGKRPLVRPRCRWVGNIKMDLGVSGLDWSGSGYGQVESAYKCDNGLSGTVKCWEIIEWLHNW
jgi:hypothetical protein